MNLSQHPELAEQCRSPVVGERLSALRRMRQQIDGGAAPKRFFDLALPLIGDDDNNCRWQALIVVGECIESHPDEVWPVIQEYGVSADADMRDGVSTVLLEHMLEHHFDWTMERLKQELGSAAGAELLRDTLRRCHAFGVAIERWSEVTALTEQTEHTFRERLGNNEREAYHGA